LPRRHEKFLVIYGLTVNYSLRPYDKGRPVENIQRATKRQRTAEEKIRQEFRVGSGR
jgi:hypothetical protein